MRRSARGRRGWSHRHQRARILQALGLLLVLSPSRAGALIVMADVRTHEPVHDVELLDGTIYLACGAAGLHALDVSGSRSPVTVGVLDEQGDVRGVAARGRYVYAATNGGTAPGVGPGSLRVIDARRPGQLREVGLLSVSGSVLDVEGVGRLVFLANDRFGLRIVDVSKPRAPREVGRLDTPGTAVDVEALDGLVYVADLEAGLRIVDVGAPDAPVERGALDTPGLARGVAVLGGFAYVADDTALRVIDVSNPAAPQELAALELLAAGVADPASAVDVSVAGGIAYVADGSSGLRVVDVSDPGNPRALGAIDLPSFAVDVAVGDGFAYVAYVTGPNQADPSGGLQVVDVRRPTYPAEIGGIDVPDAASLEVVGGRAYVAALDAGLLVIDVSDPTAPTTIGGLDPPGIVTDVEVVDDLAYLVERHEPFTSSVEGLHVIDVSDPAVPVEVGVLALEDPRGLGVEEGIAYVPTGLAGLRLVDVSAPAAPALLATFDTPGVALGVVVGEGSAYVADGTGLQVVDVSDPREPRALGRTGGGGAALELVGGLLYAASSFSGLRVMGISPTGWPFDVGFAGFPGTVYVLSASGGLAWASTGESLVVLDVSRPAQPVTLGALDAFGEVETSDGLVFVAGGSALRIFHLGPEYVEEPGSIDVVPGSTRNRVRPGGGGSIRAAVLGSETFDPSGIDVGTLGFGPRGGRPRGSPVRRDVNRDGFADLVARFPARSSGVDADDDEVCVVGQLTDGTRFEGCDAIETPARR